MHEKVWVKSHNHNFEQKKSDTNEFILYDSINIKSKLSQENLHCQKSGSG
jgi:hypothetical protein